MGWKKIGKISVDAGLVFIGDPCYLSDKNPFQKWNKFVEDMGDRDTAAITHDQKVEDTDDCAMGIISSTGWGDGTYDVLALIEQGRVLELRILFDTSVDDEYDAETNDEDFDDDEGDDDDDDDEEGEDDDPWKMSDCIN